MIMLGIGKETVSLLLLYLLVPTGRLLLLLSTDTYLKFVKLLHILSQ